MDEGELRVSQQDVRELIAQEIEEYARKSYQGAGDTDNVDTLATAEYINTALQHAAEIARGNA